MKLYAKAYTQRPAWAQEPKAHRAEIARFALSFVDPEERLAQFLPPLSHDGALALLLDLAEDCREAAGRVALAEHHAAIKEQEGLRFLLNDQSGNREEFQAEAERCAVLFLGLCWALAEAGETFTGGELSQARRGLPAELSEALDGLKAVALPDAERLTEEDTAALYEGLTREGLISGPLRTFSHHLGRLSTRKPKGPESALSWTGSRALFAYFVWRFSLYTQPGGLGYTIREQALCSAFCIDERTRRNTIRPTLSDLRQDGSQLPIQGREAIDRVFSALPGFQSTTL